jgi:hypothetical protein
VHPRVTTCHAALGPTSQLGWAPGLPRVQRFRDPPPSQGRLRCCHVYHGFGPAGRAPERRVSCGTGSSLPMGRAPGYHASCRPLWVVSLKHKEKPSRPACAAMLSYSQHTCTRFQAARCQGQHGPTRRVDRHCSQCLQDVWTCCYSAARVQCQPC